jgi:tetratricopeptide (TPR) repeat protein
LLPSAEGVDIVMINEVEIDKELPADLVIKESADDNKVEKLQKRKKFISFTLFVFAFFLVITGIQALIFYSKFLPQIDDTNGKLYTLTLERTRGEQLKNIQEKFQSLRTVVKGQGEISSRIESIFEIMGEHFSGGPLGTIEQVQSELQITLQLIQEKLAEEGAIVEVLAQATNEITQLEKDFEKLHEVYFIPYEQLHSELQNTPWYLWPTAGKLRNISGYLNAVTFNRAMYLSQIGEIGTARVLLSGMSANSDNHELLGLVYYGLGRLQWELFLTRLEPENYFQAVNYLRQSLQADPESSLAKRLFDYMLSLTEAESTPGAGKGDPTTLTEGEAGAVQNPPPLF